MPRAAAFLSPLLWVLAVGGLGCAHVISSEMRGQVAPHLSFTQILQSPDDYKDQRIILGGKILQTRNFPDRSEVEVLQKNLDATGMPSRGDYSGGRFIIVKAGYLEGEIYSKGRWVTVAGRILGSRTGKVDDRDYSYPVIEAEELHLWEEYSQYNYYPYYDPFWYPYYGSPYPYYGPFYPGHHPHH